MNRKWTGLIAALALVGVAGGTYLWRTQPLTVELAKARTGPATELVYATGFVEAQQPVSIASRITAPVARVLVAEGDRVHAGQPLVVLIDDEQRGLLAQSDAQSRSAAQVEARTLALFKQGWVTRAARDKAVADADAARAGRTTAAARLDQLVVRASADGLVTKRDVEPGDLATPARVLFQLGDPARIRITATVDERDIARVHTGAAALMSSDAWPGRALAAHVAQITPSGDPTARAFRVRLRPDGAAGLPLGLTLEVNIIAHRDDHAVLVPATAVTAGKIWVVKDDRAHATPVRTGVAGKDSIQILTGIAAGDTVVVNPPADLVEGRKLRAARP